MKLKLVFAALLLSGNMSSAATAVTKYFTVEFQGSPRAEATARALENIRKELTPRLDLLISRLPRAERWKALFPVRVILDKNTSPLEASAEDFVNIGDRATTEQAIGWSQILAHETGHVLAFKLGLKNPFLQEFYADFFARAVFGGDKELGRGFGGESRAILETGRLSKVPEDARFAETQLSFMGEDSLRKFDGNFHPLKIYSYPERYLISVTLNRALERAANRDQEKMLLAGLDLLRESGAELGSDLLGLAEQFDAKIGGTSVRDALESEGMRAPILPRQSLAHSLRVKKPNANTHVFELMADANLLAEYDGIPVVTVRAGKRVAFALALNPKNPSRVSILRGQPCRSDKEVERIEPGEALTAEILGVSKTGTYLREVIQLIPPSRECLVVKD